MSADRPSRPAVEKALATADLYAPSSAFGDERDDMAEALVVLAAELDVARQDADRLAAIVQRLHDHTPMIHIRQSDRDALAAHAALVAP